MPFNPNTHMMRLKGKDYLQVMWRLVWFREDHPQWQILTKLITYDFENGFAVFKASIIEPNTENVLATAHGSESRKDFGDYLEKAETKAVGRALAILGYGTQFAPELDEESRIVDSPVQRKQEPAADVAAPVTCDRCGNPVTGICTKTATLTAAEIIAKAKLNYGGCYCYSCMKELRSKNNGGNS